jgi:molybdopterin converting factor small subunit
MNRKQVLQTLQSDAVKDCAESVKDDNPDLTKSQSFAICQSMENDGELSTLSFKNSLQDEDPCEDGWVMVGTKMKDGREVPNCVPEEDASPANLAEDCPEGEYMVNGECREIKEFDPVPPTAMSAPRVMKLRTLRMGPIERVEAGEDTVRYEALSLLDEGVWTDQRSRTPTLYSAEHFSNYEPEYSEGENGPPVNIMHDLDDKTDQPNDVSVAGYIDPNSLRRQGSTLAGDIVLDTSKPAGEYADENLQSALESGGSKGFGGPSVELDPVEMQDTQDPQAAEEVVSANLTGAGLVMEPASKSVSFEQETAKRSVALSSQSDKDVYTKQNTMEPEAIREEFNLSDDIADDTLVELADAGALTLEDDEEDDDEDMGEMPDEDDEEDADMEEYEMQDIEEAMEQIQELRSRLESIEEEHEQLMNAELAEQETVEELSQEMEEAKEELADADTVQELEQAKEELDKRLQEIENEPEDPKTLADGESGDDVENLTSMEPRRSRF